MVVELPAFATTQVRGVGSFPKTIMEGTVKPTTMNGTTKKLEMGYTGIYSGCRPDTCSRYEAAHPPMRNTLLGESWANLPVHTFLWKNTRTELINQIDHPHRGGRMDPRQDLTKKKQYSCFTITTSGKRKLQTQSHTGSSYHGLMFSVRAEHRPLRITKLHMACGGNPRRELYRVYVKKGMVLDGFMDASSWQEVAAGEAELPCSKALYGLVPFPEEGVRVQPGEVMSLYVHCPYNQQGVCFRKFARSWPGYPRADAVTDGNKDLSILVARATYSQTPFERLSKDGYAFAGIIEYDFIGTKSMFQTATAALDQTKQNPLANK
ncbi:hypothetical protein GUITHDRAFT_163607 [Guillardia theta CCMP2712]|uniref:Uncharacterized protein n=1 Tax=Guillardia theta (strain CCMP2712) TaxID=905079 RepID=L1J7K5_GUITC|nr:hypothetical protein GUITHDRAFT_163607 [Guillardia theta CCMP2712]EKX44282.1 hypothetical protein GUITHDRAFT_163607 [Guillardia theta CCMP2712]|mmetsp:Transcript_35710/g.111705  ORF Transcript_35710/g.111705 Transcript_35710/m.111705 type:complete len:322 (-) Transcript_35710:70-1035(-)|eukprot:XP_005831262.1 hypothetical protein GUITHDRAFT_163607 [Guillardia theta CCMP2712]